MLQSKSRAFLVAIVLMCGALFMSACQEIGIDLTPRQVSSTTYTNLAHVQHWEIGNQRDYLTFMFPRGGTHNVTFAPAPGETGAVPDNFTETGREKSVELPDRELKLQITIERVNDDGTPGKPETRIIE